MVSSPLLPLLFSMPFFLVPTHSQETVLPKFPTSFTATLTITANLLPKDTTYPPRVKTLSLSYSLPLNSALVSSPTHTHVRHYQTEDEYLVKHGTYPSCQRSHLPTSMPEPTLPAATHVGSAVHGGVPAEHYIHDIGVERVHMYFSHDLPLALVHEQYNITTGAATALMTYEYSDVQVVEDGDWEEEAFDVPGYGRSECELHVGGYPYMHLWHHYLRV